MQAKSFASVFLLCCLVLATFVPNAIGQDREREIGNLQGDVYYAKDLDAGEHITTFMVTPEGIILGDPLNEAFSEWLKAELDEWFDVPVRYVFYSHHHWDHATGAAVWADTARIVGQENMLPFLRMPPANTPLPGNFAAMDTNGDGRIEEREATGNVANQFRFYDENIDGFISGAEAARGPIADVEVPGILFSDRTTLRLGGKRVDLISVPIAHANDLTVAHFPQDGVVYYADFANIQRLPGFEFSAELDEVAMVEALDFDLYVAGHGGVGTRQDFIDHRRYREDLRNAVRAGMARGMSLPEMRESILLEGYSEWMNYTDWRIPNINGMYDALMQSR